MKSLDEAEHRVARGVPHAARALGSGDRQRARRQGSVDGRAQRIEVIDVYEAVVAQRAKDSLEQPGDVRLSVFPPPHEPECTRSLLKTDLLVGGVKASRSEEHTSELQ